LLCFVMVPAGFVAEADAAAWLKDAPVRALEANERWEQMAAELQAENARLREENGRLREELAGRDAELERVNAELAVLQRLVFGRSSERARPEAAGGGDGKQGRDLAGGGEGGRRRGPGARAGRRDYSQLPRVEVIWDFPGGGHCCPECGEPFTLLGDHVIEQLDWQVTVRLLAHCRRRYRRACSCRVPATVMAPGPPKAIGKGLLSNAFIAMLLAERYVAGRSQNSLVAGLARHGADVSPATLTGTCAAAGSCLPRWGMRSPPGPGTPGTCMLMRRPGTCSPRARGAARPAGGCGCSLALTPSAS
jgi:transposase